MSEKTERIKGGYYIKARCISDSWIAHSAPVVRETWDYLLREANHKENKYGSYTIKRGQLFRTYRQIRDALSWMVGASRRVYTVNQMKHTMKLLSKHTMIKLANQPRGVLITVCNYEYYQNPKNYESTSESPMNILANQPRMPPPSSTINKNVKNDKNVKKLKTLGGFEKFYKAYPHKKNKEEAKKAWEQVFVKKNSKYYYKPISEDLMEYILNAIDNQKEEKEMKANTGQFCEEWAHPSSWLRSKRWEDQTISSMPRKKSQREIKKEKMDKALME